jgi:hypothetical protein
VYLGPGRLPCLRRVQVCQRQAGNGLIAQVHLDAEVGCTDQRLQAGKSSARSRALA